MRISSAFLIVVTFCSLCAVTSAQSPTDGTPAQGTPSAQPTPSGLLQPALDQVQQTVSALKVDKWKRGTVRDDARDNISAILRDLHTTLPPLLDTADATPGTISRMLPVSRNIAALYDVLLRVVEAARITASSEESTQLEQALKRLGAARAALDDRLQASVVALEKQEVDLRSTLQASEAAKCPTTPTSATPGRPKSAPNRKAKRIPQPPAMPPQPSPSPANSTPKTQN
ncbi:MAG: hypothetical protein ABR905_05340 [Terracidiphilus sp.]|jgi:hypothetical protein